MYKDETLAEQKKVMGFGSFEASAKYCLGCAAVRVESGRQRKPLPTFS